MQDGTDRYITEDMVGTRRLVVFFPERNFIFCHNACFYCELVWYIHELKHTKCTCDVRKCFVEIQDDSLSLVLKETHKKPYRLNFNFQCWQYAGMYREMEKTLGVIHWYA